MRRIDPRVLVIAGAACISVSAMFVKLSGVAAGTAAFYRCLLALPVLVPLALWERRRTGPPRRPGIHLLAGLFLGADLVLWGASISHVGAGIATVLVNLQVVVLPLLALLVFRERPSRAFAVAVPLMLAGVALAGGLADGHEGGSNPLRGVLYGAGAGATYAGYLFLTRLGGQGPGLRFNPVLMATVAAGAAATVIGVPWNGVDLAPGWAPFGWLAALAMSGQVCGWLLIGAGLPRLRTEVGGTLLLLQPILAVVLGAVLLAEQPTLWQGAGCALVVLAVWLTGRSRPGTPIERPPTREPERPHAGQPA